MWDLTLCDIPEIPAPTTVSTTESYYRNSKHKKPYPMPNDFGVEELKENGKFALFYYFFTQTRLEKPPF